MFAFKVNQKINIDDKAYLIKSRTRKENEFEQKTTYICKDEIGDIHKFDETFLLNNAQILDK